MIKSGRHIIRSHMTLEYTFSGTRLRDGRLTPVEWFLSVDFVAPIASAAKKKESQLALANVTYQKIYFWLESCLPNAIIVDASNETDLYIANMVSNIMVYCPHSTNDDVISQILHAKIATLAGPNLIVGATHLKASDSVLQYTYEKSTAGYNIPDLTADYYTMSECRDNDPWWFRNDGFCFEFSRPNNVDMSDEELFGNIRDPLNEFWTAANVVEAQNAELAEDDGQEILRVEKWNPKII